MIQQWKTIVEFEASPEDGIYFVYTKIRDIKKNRNSMVFR